MPSRSAAPFWRRTAAFVASAAVALVSVVLPLATAPAASAATVDPSGWYVLVNRNSGKALDVYNRATNDGARITQWSRNDGDQQQWQFVDSGNGYYRLKSRLSGKVLDVSGRSTSDGAPIIQWTDNNSTNQQFSLQDIDGHIQLIARHSGKAVEVQGASTADGGSAPASRSATRGSSSWATASGSSTTPPTPSAVRSPCGGST